MKKLLIISLILLTACGGNTNTKEQSANTLKVGLVTWIGYTPFYVAQKKGFFQKRNLTVELNRIEGDAERRAAIASGKLDASALTLDAMIVLRAQGIPVKTILALDASIGGDGILAKPDIQSLADLKGKTVAYPSGQPSHFFLWAVLKAQGMQLNEVKPIIMDANQAGAAFIAGRVDAAVTWEPYLTKAIQTTDGHILADSKQQPGLIEDVLFVREEVIDQKKEALQALVDAWFEAVDYMQQHPEEAKQIAAEAFSITTEEVNLMYNKVRFEGKAENQQAFSQNTEGFSLYTLYNQVVEAWTAEGVIKKGSQPAEGIDPQFISAQ